MTLLLLVLIFTDGCRCVESYSQFSKRENTQKPEAWRKNKGMKYLFPDTRLHDLTLQSVTPPLLPQCRRHQALTHYNSILQFQLLTSSRRGAEARSEKYISLVILIRVNAYFLVQCKINSNGTFLVF
ncbi:uncharacterized protein LOC131045236 isoform X1 [Cryptomeria japonica]|uniref:uncharacterized protein LOC131045236 isoform X1 n=1 Tax=Cryptomeria japonica TaxID=3369 RepID=UPI0025ABE3B9|nr:uncharacterized protein LOC131045236 isoform X1 [Cryptomeria japonica]